MQSEISPSLARLIARGVVSLGLLAFAGLELLVGTAPTNETIAFGLVGTVAGYWLSQAEETIKH